jgi:hypothetical protein
VASLLRTVRAPSCRSQIQCANGTGEIEILKYQTEREGRDFVLHKVSAHLEEGDKVEPFVAIYEGQEMLYTDDDTLQRWPVSKRVNSSRASDDDPTLIEKIELVCA